MREGAAFGALFLTLTLVIWRPRIGKLGRLNPVLGAIPGAVVMLLNSVLATTDIVSAMKDLWRPLITVASVMTTTHVAHQLGIFDRVTRSIEIRTRGAVPRAYHTVFVIGVMTATAFNNDAAILLLTPIILPVIGRLYPKRQYLIEVFAFAVFAAAGVAPLSTANPMNLVVAERAGIGFNAYAMRMIPVSLAVSAVSLAMLRVVFRAELEDKIPARGPEQGSLAPMEESSRWVLYVVAAMFISYPIISFFDGPVWLAALSGAVIVSVIGLREKIMTPRQVLAGPAWDVLAFLFVVFLIALGLKNVGIVHWISRVYAYAGDSRPGQIFVVGSVSALGSALLNNRAGSLNARRRVIEARLREALHARTVANRILLARRERTAIAARAVIVEQTAVRVLRARARLVRVAVEEAGVLGAHLIRRTLRTHDAATAGLRFRGVFRRRILRRGARDQESNRRGESEDSHWPHAIWMHA